MKKIIIAIAVIFMPCVLKAEAEANAYSFMKNKKEILSISLQNIDDYGYPVFNIYTNTNLCENKKMSKIRIYCYSEDNIDIPICNQDTVAVRISVSHIRHIINYGNSAYVNNRKFLTKKGFEEMRTFFIKKYDEIIQLRINKKKELIQEYNAIDDDIDSLKLSIKRIEKEQNELIKKTLSLMEKEYIDEVNNAINKNKKIDSIADIEINLAKKEWEKQLTSRQKYLSKTLSKIEYYLSYPNSASGCDFNFEAINTSKKTIKYVYINIYGFKNAVNDYVGCEIRGFRNFCCKETGPIKSGEHIGGVWENVIYNNSARKAIISNIKIIYMDGTSVVLSGEDIKQIINMPKRVDEDKIRQKVYSELGRINLSNIAENYAKKKKEVKKIPEYVEMANQIDSMSSIIKNMYIRTEKLSKIIKNFEK